jgi:alkyl sulfatase BDS1-like metallo-beta-lactamase superfamily hydrolase
VLFNVYAIRGEEYRDPRILIPGIDNIIQWSPEYLVCAHGPGLAGKEKIREVATRYRDSIQYMWDQTVRGINKGWTMDEVATRVTLPELYDVDFYTSERYGVVEHHVRQIFMGLRGFFDGDESKLFPLEPQQRYTKLVKGFGGRAEVARQCEEALANEEIRWAVELGTWLVRSEGATQEEKNLLARCLRVVAERTPAANIRNWCITRARHLDGSFPMDRFNQHNFNPKFLSEATATSLVHTMRVLVEPKLIEGINHHIAVVIDSEEAGWHVRNSVIVPTNGWGAQSLVRMSRATFLTMIGGRLLWSEAVASGDITVTGSIDIVDQVRRAIENKGIAG